MSINSKPPSECIIGDNISPYTKLVAKFYLYVVETDGNLSGRMDIDRDSKHLTHDEIIQVLEYQLKIQRKMKEDSKTLITIREKVIEAMNKVGDSPTEIKKFINTKYPEINLSSVGFSIEDIILSQNQYDADHKYK